MVTTKREKLISLNKVFYEYIVKRMEILGYNSSREWRISSLSLSFYSKTKQQRIDPSQKQLKDDKKRAVILNEVKNLCLNNTQKV